MENTDGSSDPFFDYYVFTSANEEPSDAERQSGVYLRGLAESTYLRPFFARLYDKAGIGITTSDCELISEAQALRALEDVLVAAIDDVRGRPKHWPVLIGYQPSTFSGPVGPPVYQPATRDRLLSFLQACTATVQHALAHGRCVHFEGGR